VSIRQCLETPGCGANEDIVWTVQAEAEKERAKQASVAESLRLADEVKARREAMRREAGLPAESGSSEGGR
jgi:hypothetical protein